MNRNDTRVFNTARRRLGALAILTTTCAAMFVGVGAAYADTDASGSATASDPAPSAYPPAESCALQGQPSSVVPGATVTITGVAASNAQVSAVLNPGASTIGSTTASGTGSYSVAASVPTTAANGAAITVGGVTCATVVVAASSPPPAGANAVSPIIATPTISSSLEATTASAPTTAPVKAVQVVQAHSSKPLAFTGASVLVPGVLGVVLIGGGLILFLLGRRGKAGQN